jgi:GAF domain-containing protein
MLLIPMRDHDDEVIGVLQVLNAMDPASGEVIGFDEYEIDDITSLASQAAIAITNVRLVRELEVLLDAFLRVIAAAIDEKSRVDRVENGGLAARYRQDHNPGICGR